VLVLLACVSTGLTETKRREASDLETDVQQIVSPIPMGPPPIPSSELKPPIIVDPRGPPSPESIAELARLSEVVSREPFAASDALVVGSDAELSVLAGIAQDDPALGLSAKDIQDVIKREDATAKAMDLKLLGGDQARLATEAAAGDVADLTATENRLASAALATAPGSDERAQVQAEISNLEKLIGEAVKIQKELPHKEARLKELKKIWAEKYDEGKLKKDETLAETTARLLKEVEEKIAELKKKLTELEASKVKLQATLGKQENKVEADKQKVAADVKAIENSAPTPALLAEAERLGVHIKMRPQHRKNQQTRAKDDDDDDSVASDE